ncbi:MAG: PaaI family thioesterase [Actinobacteria bacterium]|nr:MAG: PaaI family thioesterase [Actinomycetota bacterium]
MKWWTNSRTSSPMRCIWAGVGSRGTGSFCEWLIKTWSRGCGRQPLCAAWATPSSATTCRRQCSIRSRRRWTHGCRRSRPRLAAMKQHMFERPAEGSPIGTFPDCVVSGDANPMGLDVQFFREGDEAVSRVVLGPAFEGAPNRAHGGVVAAVFDDLMGFVLTIHESPAYTAELTVRYRRPTPVGEQIEFRARLVDRRGRRLQIEAEAIDSDGTKIATATALFITIPRTGFGVREA